MHASVFPLDLDCGGTPDACWQACLALAAELEAVDGFVAFLALEAEDGALAGLCICVDAPALDAARRVADAWQREHGVPQSPPTLATMTGEVLVQRGF